MNNSPSDHQHAEPTEEAWDDGNEYEVEAVLAEKIDPEDGIRKYLVKWTGYNMDDCTWEPEENFQDEISLQTWREKKGSTPKASLFDYKAWDTERIRRLREQRTQGHISAFVTSSDASDDASNDASSSEDDVGSDDSLQQELVNQEQSRREKNQEKRRRKRQTMKQAQVVLVESNSSTDQETKKDQKIREALSAARPSKLSKRPLDPTLGPKQRDTKSPRITPSISKTPRRASLDETKEKVWGLSYQNRAAKVARREKIPNMEDLTLFRAGESLPSRIDTTSQSATSSRGVQLIEDVQANTSSFDFTKFLDQVESGEQTKPQATGMNHNSTIKHVTVPKDDYSCRLGFGSHSHKMFETVNMRGRKLSFKTYLEAYGSDTKEIHHILSTLYIEKYLIRHIGLPSDDAEVELVTSATSLKETLNSTQAAAVILHDSFTLFLFMTHISKFKEIFKLSPSTTSRPLRAVVYSGLNLKPWTMSVTSDVASGLHISSLHEQALPYSHQLANLLGTGVLSKVCELNVCFAFLSPSGTERETHEIQTCLSYLLDREIQTTSGELDITQIRTKPKDIFIEYKDIINASNYDRCKEVLIIMIHSSLRYSLHTIPFLSSVRLAQNKAHMFLLYGTTFRISPSLIERTTLQIYPFGGVVLVPEEVILYEGSKFQFIIDHVSRSSSRTWVLILEEQIIDNALFKILERHGISEQTHLFRLIDELKSLRKDHRIIELDVTSNITSAESSHTSLEAALDAFVQFQVEACSTYRRFVALESQSQPYNRTTRSLYTNVEFQTIEEFKASIQPSASNKAPKA